MQIDNASTEIIQKTRIEHKNYVRLYFRPRTPTQFNNEGIRPYDKRKLGAHCPIPVFFCFDAFSVMTMTDTEFSNGNMASSHVDHDKTLDFFSSIPFEYVYHTGWFPPEYKNQIIFHRNAEVLVPHSLDLSNLKAIACRTAAERQTLLCLLPQKPASRWQRQIRLGVNGFFERRWSFVEEVVVVDDTVIFRFNPNTDTPGPFDVRFTYYELGSTTPSSWQGSKITNNILRFRIPNAHLGVVQLFLDDALAFQDRIVFDKVRV
jgi:hypothetical protein